MTAKNYRAIANIVRHVLGGSVYFHPFVDTMVSYMKDDNPLFNEGKFRKACRQNPDDDGENRPEVKKLENKANEEIAQKIRKYQNDKFGAEAGMDRMNEKFEKLNKQIKEEKSQ